MQEPIRVLQVFAKLNRGGAETMMMNLYRQIDRTRVQFDFVVHGEEEGAYEREIQDLGGRIHRLPAYNGKNHFVYAARWRTFFREHPEYKIVHGHVRSTAAIYLKAAKRFGLLTIAHSHNTSSGKGLSAWVKNALQYPIRFTADVLLACSREAGEWLYGERACRREHFYILKNAIRPRDFVYNAAIREAKRQELGLDGKFVVGHVGRFDPQKNHEFLVGIFSEVFRRHRESVLLLVGDGGLREAIENKVRRLGLSSRVTFTGIRTDIPELFQAMDVFVLPSLFEGLGLVNVEAQASGLPTIVADTVPEEARVSDLMEVLPLAVSEEAWAEHIVKYAKGYTRRDTMKEIVRSGYDIRETAEWLEAFYLNARPRRTS